MADTRAVVLVLDSEHAEDARRFIRHPFILRKNPDVTQLLCGWLTMIDRMPFCVAGFFPTCKGITGGMSADWQNAISLCSLVKTRFDEANCSGVIYMSQWMIMVTDQRRRDLADWMGEVQTCEGTA